MTRVAAPALVVLVAVVSYVGLGSWNRSDEPLLRLTLTERELALPWTSAPPGEDPGLQLRLQVQPRHDPLDARNWLSEPQLAALGFALNVPAGSPEAWHVYDNVPPRRAWVALEYDGPAWRELDRLARLSPDQGPWRGGMLPSRLVPVAASRDLEMLRRRYPEGHLIVRAVIGVRFLPPEQGGPMLYGMLEEIVPTSFAVPRHLRPVFDGLSMTQSRAEPPAIAAPPRYEVDVALGRLGIPYIIGARRLE